MEARSSRREVRRLARFHHLHPLHRMVGESDLGWMHLAMPSGLELVLVQGFPTCYSRKPLPVRSHRVLVQLTSSSFAQLFLRGVVGLWLDELEHAPVVSTYSAIGQCLDVSVSECVVRHAAVALCSQLASIVEVACTVAGYIGVSC